MDFSDNDHRLAELVFQGVDEHRPVDCCDEFVLSTLEAWTNRPKQSEPDTSLFDVDGLQGLSISYDGFASNHWPDAEQNWIRESLIREFLFPQGVCGLADMSPRVFEVRYKVQAMSDTEYLLVCPYTTESGNIGGIVVVCVDHHLSQSV